MNCFEFQELFPGYLSGLLAAETVEVVDSHVAGCETCRRELAEMKSVWETLGELPDEQPSPALRGRFYAMLDNEKRALRREDRPSLGQRLDAWIAAWWPRRPAVQLALAAVVLVAGLGIGTRMRPEAPPNGQLNRLQGEVQEMQQMVSLSMLKQESSSDRLRAVSLSAGVERPSSSLLGALVNTLDTDPNVNVRLAAVDALMLFSDQPGILDKLVQSLARQQSPLVQVALIDLLIQMKERRSLEALRNLIQSQDVNPSVKQHAETKLKDLT